jgi:hypothetical protein
MQRRRFIRHTLLGAVGTVLLPSTGLFAETPSTLLYKKNTSPGKAATTPAKALKGQRGPTLLKGNVDDLKITPADTGVLDFVAGFGRRALFTGGSVGGKSGKGAFRSTHILALISDLSRYQALLTQRDAIIGDGMCIGNSICFNYMETTFELEALLPTDFDQRLAGIKSGLRADGTPMVYAHEALLYEPSTKALTDPFKALNGKLAALKRLRTPGSYEELAEGNLALAVYHLSASARDQADLNALLARPVTNAAAARSITAAFLQNLSLNCQVNPATAVQTLCGTRMLRAATQLTLGCDSQRVAGNFARQRARYAADVTDGAIWHALFQAAEVAPDFRPKAAALATAGGCKFKTFLTMQEFQLVGKIKNDSSFRIYA